MEERLLRQQTDEQLVMGQSVEKLHQTDRFNNDQLKVDIQNDGSCFSQVQAAAKESGSLNIPSKKPVVKLKKKSVCF